jgi:hypothetical protein
MRRRRVWCSARRSARSARRRSAQPPPWRHAPPSHNAPPPLLLLRPSLSHPPFEAPAARGASSAPPPAPLPPPAAAVRCTDPHHRSTARRCNGRDTPPLRPAVRIVLLCPSRCICVFRAPPPPARPCTARWAHRARRSAACSARTHLPRGEAAPPARHPHQNCRCNTRKRLRLPRQQAPRQHRWRAAAPGGAKQRRRKMRRRRRRMTHCVRLRGEGARVVRTAPPLLPAPVALVHGRGRSRGCGRGCLRRQRRASRLRLRRWQRKRRCRWVHAATSGVWATRAPRGWPGRSRLRRRGHPRGTLCAAAASETACGGSGGGAFCDRCAMRMRECANARVARHAAASRRRGAPRAARREVRCSAARRGRAQARQHGAEEEERKEGRRMQDARGAAMTWRWDGHVRSV